MKGVEVFYTLLGNICISFFGMYHFQFKLSKRMLRIIVNIYRLMPLKGSNYTQNKLVKVSLNLS